MPPEAASDIRRGRPSVFTDETLRDAARFSYAKRVRSKRGAQDLVYRKFAVAVIELYCESHPERAGSLRWLTTPELRHSLLSELGRIGEPRSDEDGSLEWSARDVNRLIEAALEISETRPTTKAGVAMIRERRRRWRFSVSG